MLDEKLRPRHITRMDSGNTHGWWARVLRCGVSKQKFFADLSYESKDWAYIQSLIWLDDAIDKLTVIAIQKKFKTKEPKLDKNGKTSQMGKTYMYGWHATVRLIDNKYPHYMVSYGHKSSQRFKSFGLSKYTKEVALGKAMRFATKINDTRMRSMLINFENMKDVMTRFLEKKK